MTWLLSTLFNLSTLLTFCHPFLLICIFLKIAREQKKHPQALDSTGQPIEAADNTDDPPLSPRLDSFELPVNAVYPGEIEDIQESPRQKDLLKMRHLDISTTAGGSTENAPDGSTGNTLCGSTGNAPGGSTGNALGGSTGSTQDGSTEHLLGGTTESASTASKVPELGSNELSVKDPDKVLQVLLVM